MESYRAEARRIKSVCGVPVSLCPDAPVSRGGACNPHRVVMRRFAHHLVTAPPRSNQENIFLEVIEWGAGDPTPPRGVPRQVHYLWLRNRRGVAHVPWDRLCSPRAKLYRDGTCET